MRIIRIRIQQRSCSAYSIQQVGCVKVAHRVRSNKVKGRLYILIMILCFSVAQANAAIVTRDLLGGLGDFEWSAVTQWYSDYTGTDCDWNATCDEWHQDGTTKWGNNVATPGDSVAPGWARNSSTLINPSQNIIYQIVNNAGIGGSNCQYLAIKNLNLEHDQTATTDIQTKFQVSNNSWDIHVGDRVKFKIDWIRMDGFSDLPGGTSVKYILSLMWSGGGVEKVLPASTYPLQSPANEIEATVNANVKKLTASVRIVVNGGGLETQAPGVYIDGAHLYIKRAGQTQYETEEVPVTSYRTINTITVQFTPEVDDLYFVAKNYDHVLINYEGYYPYALRLKYYNPDVKVYLYEYAGMSDYRTDEFQDSLYSYCPIGFLTATMEHPEWFYPLLNPPNPDPREPEWRQVPYLYQIDYPSSYYVHVADTSFQDIWKQNSVQHASAYHMDGIFIDGPNAQMPEEREPWECQSFAHGVIPTLKAGGLDVMKNGCSQHLDGLDFKGKIGQLNFDPWWLPNDEFSSPQYNDNTPTLTPNSFFQEAAFFEPWGYQKNTYDSTYWLRTIQDMDVVYGWNIATGDKELAPEEKKWIHLQVWGVDNPDDPADGLDGWLRFGLTSFLLAQHQWSTLGWSTVNTNGVSGIPDVNYDITGTLATPAEPHAPYNGDELLRYRWYYGSNNAAGGLIMVNGDTETPKQFQAGTDLVDETGRLIPATNTVTLKPHTGRILLNQTNYKYTSTVQGPAEGEVVFPGTYTIRGNVKQNRSGLPKPSAVQVKVDNDKWKKVLVNRNGDWIYPWLHRSPGRHMIYTRTYVNVKDTEPVKMARQVYCTNNSNFKPLDTIVDGLMQPDGRTVWLRNKRVTTTSQELPGMMYIQDIGISSSIRGVKVIKPQTDPKITETGETVDVLGIMTTIGGERCIVDAMVTSKDTLKIDLPVMTMPNMAVGGADWNYNPATGAGQRGITGASGANNIGMLVRTYGSVTGIDSSTFFISDGSRANLKVLIPPGVSVPPNGSWVTVTGISSCEQAGDVLNRLIRVRTQTDIQILNGG